MTPAVAQSPVATSSTPTEKTLAAKIPIAIVGLNFGRHIIDAELLQGSGFPYFTLAGICDLDRGRAAAASTALGIKAFGNLEEVLADPAIPAVALYTGPSGRAGLIRQIIHAGKDVMTTKPFELDPEAALAVLLEARELGRIIHLNSPAPVLPDDLLQIAEWRARYDLGKPIACRADVWAHYREQADGSWLDDPEKCPVAPIFRLGIYLINDLIALFGEAEEVQVFSSRLTTGRPTPDTAQLGLRFKNGGLANIFSSFCVNDGDPYRNSLTLNFENGTVYRNAGPHRVAAGSAGSELTLVLRRNGERIVAAETETAGSGHYRWDLFYRALGGEKLQGEIAPEQIVAGLKVIRAMSLADRTGRSVRVE